MQVNKEKLFTVAKVAAVGFAYYLFITCTGYALPCPVHVVSRGKILCPGCGITRMLLSLVKFDFMAALHYNAAIFCLLPLWIVGGSLWLTDKGERTRSVIGYFSLVVLLIFGVLRNIPAIPIY